MNQFLKNLIQKFSGQNLTVSRGTMDISRSREVLTPPIREARLPSPAAQAIDSLACPYCFSKNFQKRGLRVKKLEKVQLYLCKDCGKTFTPQITKGKHYPLAVMLDALSVYNLGYSLEETCRIVNQKMITKKSAFADLVRLTDSRKDWSKNLENNISSQSNLVNRGVDLPGIGPGRLGFLDQSSKPAKPTPQPSYTMQIQPSTLSAWLSEFKDNLPYLRLREFFHHEYENVFTNIRECANNRTVLTNIRECANNRTVLTNIRECANI